MRLKTIVAVSAILLLVAVFAQAEVIDERDDRQEYAKSVSQLVKSGDGSVSSDLQLRKDSNKAYTLVLFRTLEGTPDFGEYNPSVLILGPHGCFTAAYPDKEAALAAVEYLKSLPDIIYAELDGDVHASTDITDSVDDKENDPVGQYSFHSYGASEMGFGKVVPWCKKVGIGTVTVSVIDSGVYPHPFISARLKTTGFDYVDNDNDPTNDSYGHGTHVAGIIVDCTPELPVNIHPIRVLDSSGKGRIANTTSALFEAAEAGCDVINLSLVTEQHSEALEDAVGFALNCGCSVVISAGNNGSNSNAYCPVHMENAGLIVVGACSGSLSAPVQASYSNYGANVDVFAFGTSIQSCSTSGGFVSKTGTSQAAPHISALCSILKRLFPSIGCGQVETKVKLLAGSGKTNVPNASLLVPQTMGVSAQKLYLPVGTKIKLLQSALPKTAFIDISWFCENETIAVVDKEGMLSCLEDGETILYGDGPANADISVTLRVFAENLAFHIPSTVTTIETDAFSGTAAKAVYLPASLEVLAGSAFIQNNLTTIFYRGSNYLFDELHKENKDVCIITDEKKQLWQKLDEAGINYLISCEE